MTTQPTCPTCIRKVHGFGDPSEESLCGLPAGATVHRLADDKGGHPFETFTPITPTPDVSGDEEWDEFRTHEHFGNRLGDRTHCCYRAGLNARRNPQQTDEAIRAMAQRIAAELSHDYLRDFGIGITAVVADRIADVLRGEK
jgi:hypothetical protein